tara:strand:- start:43 stop:864 length:822 start_codon:yes stop_codon:yes gene_type:complete
MPDYDVNPTGGSQKPRAYGIRSIGNQIKNDFLKGVGLKEKDDGYRARTRNSKTKHDAAVDRRKKRRKKRRAREQAAEVATPEVVQPDQQTNQAMLNRMSMQQEQAARAANMDRARMMFEQQNMRSPGPVPRQMQGLGGLRNPNMPRIEPMMPYRQQNQATSPAFRYAGQNYDRLGGMQRSMPRPMEMMNTSERQQIGQMADRMEQPMPMQNPYVGILQRGISAKGGGRTMPQIPPSRFGGPGKGSSQTMPQGQMNPQLMAALASRFGGSQGIF